MCWTVPEGIIPGFRVSQLYAAITSTQNRVTWNVPPPLRDGARSLGVRRERDVRNCEEMQMNHRYPGSNYHTRI